MYTATRSTTRGCTCTRQQEVPHDDKHVHNIKNYHTRMYMFKTPRSITRGCTCTRQQEVPHEDVHVLEGKK